MQATSQQYRQPSNDCVIRPHIFNPAFPNPPGKESHIHTIRQRHHLIHYTDVQPCPTTLNLNLLRTRSLSTLPPFHIPIHSKKHAHTHMKSTFPGNRGFNSHLNTPTKPIRHTTQNFSHALYLNPNPIHIQLLSTAKIHFLAVYFCIQSCIL